MYCDVRGLVSTGVGNLIDATREAMTPPTGAQRQASHQMARRFNWLRLDGSPAGGDEVDAVWDAVKARMDLAPQGHRAYENLTSLKITNDGTGVRLPELPRLRPGRRFRGARSGARLGTTPGSVRCSVASPTGWSYTTSLSDLTLPALLYLLIGRARDREGRASRRVG